MKESASTKLNVSKWRRYFSESINIGELPDDDLANAIVGWIAKRREEFPVGTCFEVNAPSMNDGVFISAEVLKSVDFDICFCRISPNDCGIPIIATKSQAIDLIDVVSKLDADLTVVPVSGKSIFGISIGPHEHGGCDLMYVMRGAFNKTLMKAQSLAPAGVVFLGN